MRENCNKHKKYYYGRYYKQAIALFKAMSTFIITYYTV